MKDKKELNKEELDNINGGVIVNYQEHPTGDGGTIYNTKAICNNGSSDVDTVAESHEGDTAGIGGGSGRDSAGPGGKKGYR